MHVYLLRHGIAEDDRPGLADADRALTTEGRRKLRQVLQTASRAEVQPSLILTSPLKRAIQTAEIARDVLKHKNDLVRSNALVPDGSPKQAWEEVRAHRDETSIMLVGHNPLFASLAGFLLGDESLRIDLKKGSILCVDCENFPPEPRGTLRWYLIPKLAGGNG